jgi:hypothetical protein
MQWQCARSGARLALAALIPVLHGCYEYVPIATASAPVGQFVELQVTDRGRVGLGDRFGSGVQVITGRLVSEQANDLVIAVSSIKNIDGETTRWSNDTTRVSRDFITTVKGRRLSTTRTALLALAGGVAVYLMVSSKLLGAFADSEDEGDTGPPATSTRIPVIP